MLILKKGTGRFSRRPVNIDMGAGRVGARESREHTVNSKSSSTLMRGRGKFAPAVGVFKVRILDYARKSLKSK